MEIRLFSSLDEAVRQLPLGKPKLARAGKVELCLVRFDDTIYVFDNRCPHMGEQLHKGTVNYLSEIVCPLHTYRFHMKTGEESAGKCGSLRTYPITEKEEGLFINLD